MESVVASLEKLRKNKDMTSKWNIDLDGQIFIAEKRGFRGRSISDILVDPYREVLTKRSDEDVCQNKETLYMM